MRILTRMRSSFWLGSWLLISARFLGLAYVAPAGEPTSVSPTAPTPALALPPDDPGPGPNPGDSAMAAVVGVMALGAK